MQTDFLTPFLSGLTLTVGLIIAFGPQNAFLLRQGLSNTHLRTAVFSTIGCEVLLVAFGVGGIGAIVQKVGWLRLVFAVAGALFLSLFAFSSAKRALSSTYDNDKSKAPFATSHAVLLAALSFSLLNPASLFDTVILIGGFAGQFDAYQRIAYAFGSLCFSSLWFSGLIYGARQLAPFFQKPIAWRIFDWFITIIMAALALKLLWSAFS